jgi:uncharacterized protein (TIGR02001 family)
MKGKFASALLVLTVTAAAAHAADLKMVTKAPPPPPPSPWDIAFGAGVMNDYVFRGITQSNHKASVAAYFEPRYNISKDLQIYAGIAGESINFPNTASAEIDIYAGIRPTFGPLALDVGFWYYWYPGGTCYNGPDAGCVAIADNRFIKSDLSFWEVFAKGTYTVNDSWALGFNEFYTPSFLNSGAYGNYLSGTVKWTAPAATPLPAGVSMYVSGEAGYQWLGTTDSFYGIAAGTPIVGGGVTSGIYAGGVKLPSYATWNVGVGFSYKVFTLDLRYSDTNLSKLDCYVFTGDYTAVANSNGTQTNPGGITSNWCGATFIAKFTADLTLDSLK